MIRHILISAGFVNISGNYVTLTAAGKETAIKLDAILNAKKGTR